jgi:hypothetical protein
MRGSRVRSGSSGLMCRYSLSAYFFHNALPAIVQCAAEASTVDYSSSRKTPRSLCAHPTSLSHKHGLAG